jgi:hypothetical protein
MEKTTIKNILDFLDAKEGKELPRKTFDSLQKYIDYKRIRKLEKHPDGTQYRYEGNLLLSYSNIKKLPNDLYVDGELFLDNCKQLTKLPNELYVDGSADLTNLNITKLPYKLHVEEYLDLDYCVELTKLSSVLYVGGTLNLNDCVKIKELLDNLYVGGVLGIVSTQIEDFPNNLFVGKDINIANTPLAEKYTDEEIRRNKNLNGGKFEGKIFR